MFGSKDIIAELKESGSPEKAAALSRFFKTGKGEYGEGDLFIGVKVPQIQAIIKKYKDSASISLVKEIIISPYHEARMAALFLLIHIFGENKKDEKKARECVDFYLSNTRYVNNWDLVDISCGKILGPWFENHDRKILYDLADSSVLWEQRIAMVTCLYFIKRDDFTECKAFANKFIGHKHDLMHKATGWMLREMGKKNERELKDFLSATYNKMPRTMLRYAIEKFPQQERKLYLEGKI